MIECLTQNRGVADSSLIGVTVLCPSCADPGIFVRGGGGGGPGQSDNKSYDNVFFGFFSPPLILQDSNG